MHQSMWFPMMKGRQGDCYRDNRLSGSPLSPAMLVSQTSINSYTFQTSTLFEMSICNVKFVRMSQK